MSKLIVSITLLLISTITFAQTKYISAPYIHFSKTIQSVELSDTFKFTFLKIAYDFNKDGLTDLALTDKGTYGFAGGEWYIYFKKNRGKFFLPVKVFFHASAFISKKTNKKVVFISYLRSNAMNGYLEFTLLKNRKFIGLSSKKLSGPVGINAAFKKYFTDHNIETYEWTPKCKSNGLNNCYPKL